ncbi:MAG: DUF2768 family protein, partial [Acidobacteria bacterium]|nr:DUF2768 family protein [Acidobacteriota bacterium]
MVTSTKKINQIRVGPGSGPRKVGPNGGPRGNGQSGNNSERFSPNKYRIGMWVALAGVAMMFVALTSAYVVRTSTSNDWRPIAMPRLL